MGMEFLHGIHCVELVAGKGEGPLLRQLQLTTLPGL